MPITLEKAQEYIRQLDLNYIIDSMCDDRYPLPLWQRDDAKACCGLYKNFLWLNKKYPGESLVPSREIDEFWHNHILYTRNYVEDCLNIFGQYLHHEPASPDENPEALIDNYQKTKALYLVEFKQPLELIVSKTN